MLINTANLKVYESNNTETIMSKQSYTTDLLNSARLLAVAEDDALLIYLIEMAIDRSKRAKVELNQKTA